MKCNTINLYYISYYKLNKKKKFNKIFFFLYIFKKYNKLIFKYFNLPLKKKSFTLLKSPKCYKVGKFLINYKYYRFFFKIFFKSNLLKFNQLINYFFFLKKKYNIYQSLFTKNTKISIKINITYNLSFYMICIFIIILIMYNLYFFSFIIGIFYVFASFLFMFLQILFFTTCERKILALTQRRLGPKVVGDMGRLQYFADALKLIAKTYTSPRKINSLFFAGSAIAAFWVSWYNFSNLSFNYGEDIMEVEYNIFFAICCSLGFSIAWLISGWASVSKYALLGCVRASLQIISYEILMGGVFLILFTITGTTGFEIFIDQQVRFSIFLFLPFVAIICFIAALMETNRPPFDLSEAESDVVAGYTIEYTGIMFGLFYLGEYVTLFTNSFILVILFSGGLWNIVDYFYLFLESLVTAFSKYKLDYNVTLTYRIDHSKFNIILINKLIIFNFNDIYLNEYKYLIFYLK